MLKEDWGIFQEWQLNFPFPQQRWYLGVLISLCLCDLSWYHIHALHLSHSMRGSPISKYPGVYKILCNIKCCLWWSLGWMERYVGPKNSTKSKIFYLAGIGWIPPFGYKS
ncbi:unnamed protein product [Cuscuta epithymum]|uniref:Uncharacterized protein n=1 Tax=Cuscuta epithymum TaxID=186058 RepID=A0AAV0DBL7_9ASTE|nr:unnamed protein product [Cuscuta epithymum]